MDFQRFESLALALALHCDGSMNLLVRVDVAFLDGRDKRDGEASMSLFIYSLFFAIFSTESLDSVYS